MRVRSRVSSGAAALLEVEGPLVGVEARGGGLGGDLDGVRAVDRLVEVVGRGRSLFIKINPAAASGEGVGREGVVGGRLGEGGGGGGQQEGGGQEGEANVEAVGGRSHAFPLDIVEHCGFPPARSVRVGQISGRVRGARPRVGTVR